MKMDRRTLLKAGIGAVAVVAPVSAFSAKPDKHLPVRISSEKSDIGYWDGFGAIPSGIYVDDVDQPMAITADETKGYAIILVEKNANYKTRTDHWLKVVRGNVRIEGMSQSARETHIEQMSHRVLMVDESA